MTYTKGRVSSEAQTEGRRNKSKRGRSWETEGRERKTLVLPSVPSLAGRCFLLPKASSQEMLLKPCKDLKTCQEKCQRCIIICSAKTCSLQLLETWTTTDLPSLQPRWKQIGLLTDLVVITATAKCHDRGYVPKVQMSRNYIIICLAIYIHI